MEKLSIELKKQLQELKKEKITVIEEEKDFYPVLKQALS